MGLNLVFFLLKILSVSAAVLQASPAGELIDFIAANFGNPHDVRLDSAAVPISFKGVKPVCTIY